MKQRELDAKIKLKEKRWKNMAHQPPPHKLMPPRILGFPKFEEKEEDRYLYIWKHSREFKVAY